MNGTMTNQIQHGLSDLAEQFGIQPAHGKQVNVGELERWASAGGGAALVLFAISRFPLGALAAGVVGGALIHRAMSGHCDLYQSMGVNTAENHACSDSHSCS